MHINIEMSFEEGCFPSAMAMTEYSICDIFNAISECTGIRKSTSQLALGHGLSLYILVVFSDLE